MFAATYGNSKLTSCDGLYCGRTSWFEAEKNRTLYSQCGQCPRGFKTDSYVCLQCTDSPKLYDWLYLCFITLVPLAFNWHFIAYWTRQQKKAIILYIIVLLETILAACFSLLLAEPKGSLNLVSCGVQSLKDWYTIFYNPTINFKDKIHCTQEAVYPLYSIALSYYIWMLILLLGRMVLINKFYYNAKNSLYCSLYMLPLVALIHSIFSGIIYYSYPILTAIISSISSACFLASFQDNLWKELRKWRTIVVITAYCLANAFGVVSITQFEYPLRDGFCMLLIIVPVAFYILTANLTHPRKFET